MNKRKNSSKVESILETVQVGFHNKLLIIFCTPWTWDFSNFDNVAETFRCTYCSTEVEEEASALPKRDARTLLAKFNEQMEPIFVLLRETEDTVLPYDLLEPQPTAIPGISERYKYNSPIS